MERKTLGIVSEKLRVQFEDIYFENKAAKDIINELVEQEKAIGNLIERLISRLKKTSKKSRALYEKAIDELGIEEDIEFNKLKIETKTGILEYWE